MKLFIQFMNGKRVNGASNLIGKNKKLYKMRKNCTEVYKKRTTATILPFYCIKNLKFRYRFILIIYRIAEARLRKHSLHFT